VQETLTMKRTLLLWCSAWHGVKKDTIHVWDVITS